MSSKKIWSAKEIHELYETAFPDLIFQAQSIHRQHFKSDHIELCTLLSIKTGACPEDCAYCPQSAHYQTGLVREKLLDLDIVITHAKQAKENGATRFCMGAAWRNPPKKSFQKVIEMIHAVKKMGLETCVTLGMLDEEQAIELKNAGLDFYNHNLDTSPDYYKKIITTRTYQDRLNTLELVRKTGIKVCCGGIIGMGESQQDRIELLLQLANLPKAPESVPINHLMPVQGTPLGNTSSLDNIIFIRTLAIARIMMPTSIIRLSAGRHSMSEEMQTLCFMAGANSLFFGETLLTTPNPECDADFKLLKKLKMRTACESVS